MISGFGGWFEKARLVCHVLLVEAPHGLVLVDTGLGLQDVKHPMRAGAGLLALTRPRFDIEETAVKQVRRMGHLPDEVRDIVVTHLDPDHAGGLADFPGAAVHAHGDELDGAFAPRGPAERARYRVQQWAHAPRWVRHVPEPTGERWFGFDAVRPLHGTSDEILLIPLPGHTRGHSGVAVRTAHGWLLHAGDAFFFHGELDTPPSCPPGLRIVQRIDDHDHGARVRNQGRLRELQRAHGAEVQVICSHDPQQLDLILRRKPSSG